MKAFELGFLCGAVCLAVACAPVAPTADTPPKNDPSGTGMPSKQSDSNNCGSITSKGICVDNGSVMRWCDAAKHLRESDCAYDKGFTCKVTSGEAKCVDAATGGAVSGGNGKPSGSGTSSGCGAITADGVCSGTTLKWCQNDTVLESDCAYDRGWTCQESGGSATCVAPSGGSNPSSGCGDVPAKGICVNGGSKMQWCQNGTLMETDCAYDPENTCKMINEEAECVPIGSGGGPGTPPTPPPLGDVGSPCWTYRDCQYDMDCQGATASPPKQGTCYRP